MASEGSERNRRALGRKIKQHGGVTGKEAVNRVGMGSLRIFI